MERPVGWGPAIIGASVGTGAFLLFLILRLSCASRNYDSHSIEGWVTTSDKHDGPFILGSKTEDARLKPLAGATVRVFSDRDLRFPIEGTSATSDINGQYRIEFPPEAFAKYRGRTCFLMVKYRDKLVTTHEIDVGPWARYQTNTIVIPANVVADP
jgi:hypothetical protein